MARGYLPPANDEEKLFFRRVKELAYAAQSSGMPRHTAFLSDRQQVLARAALSSAGCADYHFDGGYPEAERAILCLHGDAPKTGAPQFGCLLVEATERHNALTHRDYLGAFLSLGIKRECIGDILPCSAGAYVFLLDTVVPLLCEELCRVGRCAVRVRRAQAQELPAQTQRPLRKASIASLRLDALLAAMLHISRADAAGLVKSGAVEINHVLAESLHAEVYENDMFSIRGFGKYHLSEIGPQSRKGRIFFFFFEY